MYQWGSPSVVGRPWGAGFLRAVSQYAVMFRLSEVGSREFIYPGRLAQGSLLTAICGERL